jgi:hypothetical protein
MPNRLRITLRMLWRHETRVKREAPRGARTHSLKIMPDLVRSDRSLARYHCASRAGLTDFQLRLIIILTDLARLLVPRLRRKAHLTALNPRKSFYSYLWVPWQFSMVQILRELSSQHMVCMYLCYLLED